MEGPSELYWFKFVQHLSTHPFKKKSECINLLFLCCCLCFIGSSQHSRTTGRCKTERNIQWRCDSASREEVSPQQQNDLVFHLHVWLHSERETEDSPLLPWISWRVHREMDCCEYIMLQSNNWVINVFADIITAYCVILAIFTYKKSLEYLHYMPCWEFFFFWEMLMFYPKAYMYFFTIEACKNYPI